MSLADKPLYPNDYDEIKEGITLRQYYAGLAMQGIVTSDNARMLDSVEEVTLLSVKLADALIAQLEKDGK